MRDFQAPTRSPVYATNGMAATSHPRATLAAIDALKAGGNAVDGAIAAAACLTVVEPHMTSAGGDVFALVSTPDGAVHGLNASGAAPQGMTLDAARALGFDMIPEDHGLGVTIPGALAGWAWLVENHGRLGLDRALRPAIDVARNGYPVAPRVARDWATYAERLRGDAGGRAHLLKSDGSAPSVGDVWVQPALAKTYERIADGGPDAFYRGEVAADLVAAIADHDGVMTEEDLAGVRVDPVTPVSKTYRGLDVLELPPNTQGVIALLMLAILEGFDLDRLDPNGADRLHLEMEAARLAYAARDRFVGDPSTSASRDQLLAPAFVETLRAKIDPARRSADLSMPDPRRDCDTVLLTVVDGDGLAISLINSLFASFGAAIVGRESGVVMQNRGTAFSLEPGHPNAVAPGKRPLHTLIPGLARRDGRTVLTFGVMGGQYQACGHSHFLTNVVDFGMDVQEALNAPRVFFEGDALLLETTLPETVGADLAARGHRVERAINPWGGGQAIMIDRDRGVLVGGSDPRKDGCALGY